MLFFVRRVLPFCLAAACVPAERLRIELPDDTATILVAVGPPEGARRFFALGRAAFDSEGLPLSVADEPVALFYFRRSLSELLLVEGEVELADRGTPLPHASGGARIVHREGEVAVEALDNPPDTGQLLTPLSRWNVCLLGGRCAVAPPGDPARFVCGACMPIDPAPPEQPTLPAAPFEVSTAGCLGPVEDVAGRAVCGLATGAACAPGEADFLDDAEGCRVPGTPCDGWPPDLPPDTVIVDPEPGAADQALMDVDADPVGHPSRTIALEPGAHAMALPLRDVRVLGRCASGTTLALSASAERANLANLTIEGRLPPSSSLDLRRRGSVRPARRRRRGLDPSLAGRERRGRHWTRRDRAQRDHGCALRGRLGPHTHGHEARRGRGVADLDDLDVAGRERGPDPPRALTRRAGADLAFGPIDQIVGLNLVHSQVRAEDVTIAGDGMPALRVDSSSVSLADVTVRDPTSGGAGVRALSSTLSVDRIVILGSAATGIAAGRSRVSVTDALVEVGPPPLGGAPNSVAFSVGDASSFQLERASVASLPNSALCVAVGGRANAELTDLSCRAAQPAAPHAVYLDGGGQVVFRRAHIAGFTSALFDRGARVVAFDLTVDGTPAIADDLSSSVDIGGSASCLTGSRIAIRGSASNCLGLGTAAELDLTDLSLESCGRGILVQGTPVTLSRARVTGAARHGLTFEVYVPVVIEDLAVAELDPDAISALDASTVSELTMERFLLEGAESGLLLGSSAARLGDGTFRDQQRGIVLSRSPDQVVNVLAGTRFEGVSIPVTANP